jgi:hypothetical protein
LGDACGPRCCPFGVEPASRLQHSQHRYRGAVRPLLRRATPAGGAVVSAGGQQRWFRALEGAPRDGTPFCIASHARFNPYDGQLEELWADGDEAWWEPCEGGTPSLYCRALPRQNGAEFPTKFVRNLLAQPLTLRERLTRYLTRLVSKVRPA